MRFDRKRWEAALRLWVTRRWFERAVTRPADGRRHRHQDVEGADFTEPNPEPALHFFICRGCRVEYIPTTVALGYAWEPDTPWLLCDYCEAVRRLRPGRELPSASALDAERRARAERRAQAGQRAEAAKQRAIGRLTATLARIVAHRANYQTKNN